MGHRGLGRHGVGRHGVGRHGVGHRGVGQQYQNLPSGLAISDGPGTKRTKRTMVFTESTLKCHPKRLAAFLRTTQHTTELLNERSML